MNLWSECEIVKMKTNFFSRHIKQNFRKECIKCTNIIQKEWTHNNEEKIKSYGKQCFQRKKGGRYWISKTLLNKLRKTDVSFRLIDYKKCPIQHASNGLSKSSSTLDILGIYIDCYQRWFEFQMIPEMNWFNIENNLVRSVCLFVSCIQRQRNRRSV